jgi:hypothetical protein
VNRWHVLGLVALALAPAGPASGAEGVPTGFLIDRQGRVRYLHRAYRASDAEGLRRQLERLLNEPAVLPAVSTPLVAPAQRRPPSQPSSPP